ncbi:MAG: zinc-binding dehydrogenase [Verrucomicrobiales bacterium]|nr:zinc-binding dehydrogenase [Verrucomicrobiales bacterium]
MPIILGHEGSGVIEDVGESVISVKPGDHVIPIWRMSCGRCEYCLGGRPALCDVGTAMRFTGLMPDGKTRFFNSKGEPILHYAGVSTFSQCSTMPEGAVVKIPKEFSLQKAALIGCGVITGMRAVFNAAEVKVGSSVAVLGCGGIGLNVVKAAIMVGASRVIAVDTVTSKLDYAKEMGATDVVNALDGDPVDAIKDLTGGLGVDYAFEAIGLPKPMEQAYDSTRKGGVCVILGIASPEARAQINVNQLVYAEKTLKGSIYGSTRPRIDLLRLIRLEQEGKLDLEKLLTKTYPLSQINEAYADLENGVLGSGFVTAAERIGRRMAASCRKRADLELVKSKAVV